MKSLSKKEIFMSIVNALFIIALCIVNYFYQKNNFNYTLKCIGSSLFALLGIINLIFVLLNKVESKKYYIITTVGLVLAMLGDVVINKNFIFGAGIFALGHVFFVIAYLALEKIKKLDLILSSSIFVGSGAFILLAPILAFEEPILRIVCLLYALIISCMLGKAISNFISNKNKVNLLLMIGSILFFFSDLMLLLSWFIDDKYSFSWSDNACMATYYPALLIYASTLLVKYLIDSKQIKSRN